jgi:hypothetical protein
MLQERTKAKACKIASFIYATAVLNQGCANVHIYKSDITKHFDRNWLPKNWDKREEFLEEILNYLMEYPGCSGVSDTAWYDFDEGELEFNLCLFTNYIADPYNAGDDYA